MSDLLNKFCSNSVIYLLINFLSIKFYFHSNIINNLKKMRILILTLLLLFMPDPVSNWKMLTITGNVNNLVCFAHS